MAVLADGYTRAVNTLKIVLPLGALGLLSTLFMFSGEVDPTQSLPYVELNVEQLANEQRVNAPYLAGVSDDGTAITIVGTAAIPDASSPDRFQIEDMRAEFVSVDNETLTAQAPLADVDNETNVAILSGGTVLETSQGLEFRSDTVVANMLNSDLVSPGAIEGTGPFGRVTADQMSMTRPAPDAPHEIVFRGNVRMVYADTEN